jgi:hypothetical protein
MYYRISDPSNIRQEDVMMAARYYQFIWRHYAELISGQIARQLVVLLLDQGSREGIGWIYPHNTIPLLRRGI